MKKIILIIKLLLFLCIPLEISGVNSSWVYYEGPIDDVSIDLSITLDKFYYGLRPGFENNDSGQNNSDALNKIEGNEGINGTGLDNPLSDLNKALNDDNLPESNFITSIDIVPNANSGNKYKQDIFKDINSNMNFIINKDSENLIGSKQVWSVYTTDYDISNLKVNKNGDISPKYIYPIYKTTYVWESKIGRIGTYTQKGETILGYAPSSINELNNPNLPFFNPSNFVPDKFIPVSDIVLDNISSIVLGEKLALNPQVLPNNATDKKLIYQSSNPKIISVNKNGEIKALKYSENEEVKIKVISIDTGLYKELSIKVIIPQPDISNSGDVIIDDNGNIEIKAKEVKAGDDGYIFPSEQHNQSLTITIPTNFYIEKNVIEIYSEDPDAAIIEAKYLDHNNILRNVVIDNPKKITVVGTGIMDSKSYDKTYILTVKANKPVNYKVKKR